MGYPKEVLMAAAVLPSVRSPTEILSEMHILTPENTRVHQLIHELELLLRKQGVN
jgi:hypothetical protein